MAGSADRPNAPRASQAVALGDTVTASIDVAGEIDTFYVTLAAGDTIDLDVWPSGDDVTALSAPGLGLFDPVGTQLVHPDSVAWQVHAVDPLRWGNRVLDPARVIADPGTYRIEVSGRFSQIGQYHLRVRRADAITVWTGSYDPEVVEGGGPVVDTFRVYNIGARTGTWTATTSGESWISLSPTSDTVGPLGTDSVAVAVTRDPTGLVRGDTATARLLAETLDPGWDIRHFVRVDVTDPRFTILAEDVTDDLWGIEMRSDGLLALSTSDSTGSSLDLMDPATGSLSPWFPDLSPGNTTGISGLTYAPDSVLWVTDNYNTVGEPVSRIFPDGSRAVIPYSGGARESTVTPDGTMYFGARTSIQKVSIFGAVTEVWTSPDASVARATALAYHPLDEQIYFAGVGGTPALRRLDPTTGTWSDVALFPPDFGSVYSMQVGASGYLYLAVLGEPTVVVMTTEGEIVERLYGPANSGKAGSVLVCGAIYGTTGGNREVYRVPVQDCPMDPGATNLVAAHVSPLEAAAGWRRSTSVSVDTDDGSEATVGAAVSGPWLSVEPASLAVPGSFALSVDATGLAAGTYVDTLVLTSAEVANSPLLRPITVHVVEPTLALGDSVTGSFAEGDDPERTYYLALDAGDVVDIGVFGPDSVGVSLGLLTPSGDGAPVFPRAKEGETGAVIPAFTAPETGTYGVRVRWLNWFAASGAGPYVLRTRPPGVVLASDPRGISLWAPAGSAALSDTLWIFNTGPGTPSWEVRSVLPSWLTADPTSGTLAAAAGPVYGGASVADATEPVPGLITLEASDPSAVTARPPPAGATPVVLTGDPTGMAAGETRSFDLLLGTPTEPWAGDHEARVVLSAVDPSLSIVTALPYRTMDVLVYSAEELIVTLNRDLWKVNRATGDATLWVENLGVDSGSYPTPTLGMEHAGDGAIYVADQTAGVIYRVEADGTSSTVMHVGGTVYDPVVLPDGTLIASAFDGFHVRNRDGTVVPLAHFEALKRSVYNPLDGWVYFSTLSGEVHRVSPLTGEVVSLGSAPGPVLDMQVGASGNLYVRSVSGHYVLSPTLELLTEISVPGGGLGIALGGPGEDVMYATYSGGGNGYLYSWPVADYRAPLPEAPASTASAADRTVFEGDEVSVPLTVDITNAGKALGSFQVELGWDPAKATFSSYEPTGFVGEVEANSTEPGSVVVAGINTDEAANLGVVELGHLVLLTGAPVGERILVDLTVREMFATDFSDLTAGMAVSDAIVRISEGLWGDPSDDRTISSLDAITCLTAVVSGTLPEGSLPERCDVAPDSDSDLDGVRDEFDGTVSALDALAILRYIVELGLPAAFRVGIPR